MMGYIDLGRIKFKERTLTLENENMDNYISKDYSISPRSMFGNKKIVVAKYLRNGKQYINLFKEY